jgi:RHS repeat-associated protein
LTAEKDLNGHTTTISYPSGSQEVITDPAGRTFTLALTNGLITQLTDSAGRTVQYQYNDGNGDLTDVIDANGGHWQYVYNSGHQLVMMRSARYYQTGALPSAPTSCTATPPADFTANVYDTSGRVICQWDPDGRQTSYDYTSISGSTKVTNPKGNVTVYGLSYGLVYSETDGYGTSQAATTTYFYDPATLGITETQDANNHVSISSYDAQGNQLTHTDALGRTTTWTYNAYNQVASETQPATYGGHNVTTTYSYDEPAYSRGGAGNLTTVSTPILSAAGASQGTRVTHYLYCATSPTPSACASGVTPLQPGDVTSMIDADGNTWSYSYDSYGDKTSETAPATSDNSDGSGVRSNVTKWVYNTGTGWVTEQLAPRFVLANPSAATCAAPAVGCTSYTYDNMDRVLTTTDGNNNTTTNHYDSDGNLSYATDPSNRKTSYTYDPAEQNTAVTYASGTTSAQTTTTNYWPDGSVEDQINAANADTHYLYDPLGHLSSVTDPDNRATGYQYDPVGNLLVRSDPGISGCTTTSTTKGCTIYGYDAANQLTSVKYNDPGVTPDVTNQTYDGDGRRASMTEYQQGSTTNTVTATWAYDSLGDLTSTTDTNGTTTTYAYSPLGQVHTIAYPNSAGTVTYGWDPAGRQQSVQDWLGNTTTYQYDADNNQAVQTAPTSGTPVVDASSFDNADNLTSISSTQGATSIDSFTYNYNPSDQITSVASTGVPSDNHTYGYNKLSQLSNATGLGAYSYDTANDPTDLAATAATAPPAVQNFDPASQLTTTSQISLIGTKTSNGTGASTPLALPTGTTANDQVVVADTVNNGLTLTTPSGYTLIGDYSTGSGSSYLQTAIYRHTIQAGDSSVTFTQSASGQHSIVLAVYRGVNPTNPIDALTSATASAATTVTAPGLTPAQPGDQLLYFAGSLTTAAANWTFPAAFNTVKAVSSTTTNTTLDDQPLTTTTPIGSQTATSGVPGELTGALIALNPAPTSYSYDSRGDLTTITPPAGTATTLTYNQARQLSGYNNTSYAYDGDSLRMSKTTGGAAESFSWDLIGSTPRLLTDTTSIGTENYIYDPQGLPLEQISNTGTVTWYHHDAQGSTRTLTDNTGTVTGTATYSPYGTTTATTGTTTSLGYTGAYTDTETGNLYLINRDYDPATAQFLTVDPALTVTQAPYTYAGDDSVNNADPSGLFCWGVCSFSNTWNDTGGKAVHYVAQHKAPFAEIAIGTVVVAGVVAGTIATGGLADAVAIGAAGAASEVAEATAGGAAVGLFGVTFPLDATLALAPVGFVGIGGLGLIGYAIYSLFPNGSHSRVAPCR